LGKPVAFDRIRLAALNRWKPGSHLVLGAAWVDGGGGQPLRLAHQVKSFATLCHSGW
jgi:hypothetical protein